MIRFLERYLDVVWFLGLNLYLPLLVAGCALIWFGVFGGSRKSGVSCKDCGEDLSGEVPEELEACPGCGVSLSWRRIKIERRAKYHLVALGVFVLVVPLVIGYAVAKREYENEIESSWGARLIYRDHAYLAGNLNDILAEAESDYYRTLIWERVVGRIQEDEFDRVQLEAIGEVLVEKVDICREEGVVLPDWLREVISVYLRNDRISDELLAKLAVAAVDVDFEPQVKVICKYKGVSDWSLTAYSGVSESIWIDDDVFDVVWFIEDFEVEGATYRELDYWGRGEFHLTLQGKKNDDITLRYRLRGRFVRPEQRIALIHDGTGLEFNDLHDDYYRYEFVFEVPIKLVKTR
ncbi:hypothetical protein KS4_02600 [Poriferisphaera corsica]|uniref:Uncharacterized protein n=1 Tax=Poriferisphaera corsica TaxID=2528020 RepID=A0A517YPU1_9BACT|nr:hypothetical protein [Poriferisphaera corsica]QDU32230.1 hypothetical protein KS4_02600 [Poriferisphaera corsica]